MDVNKEITSVFENANKFFSEIEKGKTGNPALDEALEDIATQGLVDLLSQAAQAARYVPDANHDTRTKFAECAQKMVDFLGHTGSANTLKEIYSIREINHFVKLQVPEYFAKHL